MADYPLLAVLSTGNPGEVNSSNFGKIPKLKVTDTLDVANNITVGGTVDGVDVATLSTNFSTHDGGTAKAQHSSLGDHDHSASGAEAGQLTHGTAFSDYGTDNHTEYVKADGTRAFTGTVSGVTPTADAHLVTKGYADGLLEGLPNKYACRVRAQGNINLSAPGASIDGVTMAVDDRFLADQQSTGSQDGIYLWKGAATPAVRADDFPTGFNARGSYCFIEEGTNADDGFVCTNDKGSDVVGTDDLTFIQFSGAGQITAGTGLTKTGNTIDAVGGDGIVANANDLAVDLATDPGLQFTSQKLDLKIEANKGLTKTASGLAGVADTAAGLELGASGFGINLEATDPSLAVVSTELGIKFNANGGLQKTSNGTEIKIDDTPDTLDVDSSGLKVVGLPSLFKVNNTAVGATVSAANLDELTDGSSTTLHSHALPAHLMGSASHTADTIANLNTKISDLIATYGAVRDIGVGTEAQRPAAGTAGRFWWATDTDKLFYDNGATWDTIVATPSSHASSHQHGGGDEVATATPAANAIPKADGSNKLAAGWIQEVLAYADLTDDPYLDHSARHENTGADEISVAGLSGLLADDQNPVAHSTDHKHGGGDEVATATPAANAIPKADASNKLASGWISEVLAYADLTDDPIATHAALTTGVHGAGGNTLEHTGNKGSASGYASLDGSAKVVQDPANATATPTANKIVVAEGDGKIASGWIDPADITGQDLTWAGKQEFDDEITVSTLLMDGAVIGPQISATIGTGGVTAGDTIKFDGTGQIVRRSADSDDANGVVTVGGAASATGWYCPFGIVEVTWEAGKAPTAYGQAVFLSQSPGNLMYWSTDVPTGAGKIYEGWAWGTGSSAKIFFSPRKAREIE